MPLVTLADASALADGKFLAISPSVVEMWECDLLQQLHSNPEIKTFFATVEIPEPINP
uniref:Uncharacterized protein n=1 Tax=Romanomermis culicivorax TaxID=13658 RepID=A0A915HM75_ROMCU